MKYYSKKQWTHKLTVMVLLAMALGGTAVQAMPSGGDIRSGQGSISQDGKNMTVLQNSDRMAIDWTKFDIAKDETVRYAQPDRNSISLNRVTGGQQSVIAGNLNANGNVVLVNPNGVVFTKNSSVDVGGLVASTACLNDEAMKNFGNGKDSLGLSLDKDSTASVINEGQIKAQGGLVALHAANVENKGTITNEGGTLAMAAAKNLTLSAADDDKLNFTVDGDLAKAQALNSGSLKADGGYVVMTAKSAGDVLSTVVNNSGTIEAKTLRKNEKGQILLDGGNNGQVEASGTLDASGTKAGQDAGNIKVIGQKTIVHDNTNLLAKGDNNGGKIETSGDVLNLGDNLNIDAKGVNGKAGEWLLDPLDVIIADKNNDPTGTDSYSNAEKKTASDSDFTNGSASINYNDPEATTANAASVNSAVTWIYTETVESMLNNGTNVTIQAAATNGNANIIVKNDIDKTAGDDATFTLDAMRNITVNGNITSTAGKLNVVLNADSNGDQIGAVIINANINTNGGDFTSASGGTVKYTSDSANTKGYGKGTLTGKADPAGHTVGTYFGHVDSSGTADGAKDDRLIKTSGGKITLNGEIAIGLNGGTLTLDSGGGDVTATGIINSGNSYGAYVYGTDTWDTLVEKTVESYLKSGSVPAYHYQGVNYVKNADGTYQYTTEAQSFSAGQPHYTFSEADTQNVRWLGDGSSTSVSVDKGTGYASVIITKGSMTLEQWLNYQLTYNTANFANRYISKDSGVTIVTETVGNKTNTYVRNADGSNVTAAQFKTYLSTALANLQSDTASTDTTKMLNGETVYNNLKDDISHLLATNWFASKELAQGSTGGGSAVGDSYLATITTILENSLTTPNGQQILWAGGRGSGVLNKTGSTNNDKAYPYSYYGMPDDPTYQDGMYWVTGPEGEANNGKGTQFYSNANSDWKTGNYGETVYGYVNWDTYKDGNKTRSQPDNRAPFLTVGYGTTGKWDDAAMGGDTTVGFIKETNLANSSLNIKAGTGAVSLGGDIGKAKALDTVNIESTGAVTTGTTSTDVTKYHNGTIYADHGVYISGGTVSVGGEIHSGGADVETTRNTDASFKDYLDNVTIQSSGNLTVHGIEANASTDSDGNSTSRTDGEGGKIKLTSTGTDGVITLGDGVDYNGKNTNGGVLKAASTAQGAVVIDAQGSNGGFENRTSAEKAIVTGENVTGENGTWQIYSASPDKDIFGTNLNSGTDAQWTSKSTSNTIATENKYGKNPSSYSDTSNNKFIFQATPVITLYSEDYLKTYGDEVSADTLNGLLRGKEVFTGLDEKPHNVTDYSSAFQEKDYKEYIAGEDTVTITSGGSAATATRNGGKYEATDKSGKDGKNAVYDLTVNLNEAKALDGYAIDKENGKLEIKKRSVTITSSGEQTYGDSTYTSWSDKKSGFANDDENTFTYEHGIKIGSDYETNLNKTTGRTTADAGEYKDSVSYSNPTISGKKNPDGTDDTDFFNENYALDTTESKGSITVKKADLTLSLKDVSTTYGQGFDSSTYGYKKDAADLKGLANGDAAAAITDVLQDSDFTYVNGGAKSDPNNENVKTQNAGNYQITGSTSKTLDNYNIKVVNPGNSTVGKATLTVNPEDIKRIYGQAKEVQEDAKTAYNLSGFANGDTKDTVDATNKDGKTIDQLVTVTNDVSKALKDDGTHTQNASAAGYDMATTASGDLTNYNIVIGDAKKVYLDKAALVVDTTGNTRTYGDVSNVSSDVANAASFHLFGSTDKTVNGDTEADILKELGLSTSSDALVKDKDGKVIKTGNANTDPGYDIKAAFNKDLTNYTVSEGTVGKEKIEKAALVVDTTGNTRTYGDVSNVASDVANAASFHLSGSTDKTVNGDTEADILKELGLSTSSDALVKDKDGKVIKTGNANTDPGYDIKAAFNKDLTNYTVSEGTVGKEKIEKAALVVDTTGNTRTYGDVSNVASDVANAASFHLSGSTDKTVNGDTEADILKELGLSTSSDALVKDKDGKVIKTGNANTDPGYDIKAAFNKDLTNYTVSEGTVGKEKIEKAALVVDTTGNTRTYGDVSNVASDVANAASFHLSGSTDKTVNGDTEADILKELGLSTSSDALVKDKDGKVIKTGNANTDPGYDIKAAFNKDLTNYTVSEGTVGKEKIEKAALVVDTTGNTRTYGDVSNVASDVANAASFHLSGSTDKTVNGDTEADILKELGLSTSSDALVKDKDGKVIKTGNANTDPGYDIKAAFNKDLTNYTVSEGTVGKEKIEKAALVVDTTGNTRTYGDVSHVASDVANAASFHVKNSKDVTLNGDSYDDILNSLNIATDSQAQVKDGSGNVIKTGDANTDPGYDITATFNTDLTNYTVEKGTVGQEKIEKAALVVDTKGNTRTYGDVSGVANDVANAASFHLSGSTDATANGDSYDDILKEMNLTTDSKAQIKDENGTVVKTGNANTNPGYDIKAAFDTELKNYTVSEGDVGKEKIEKATLVVDTKGNTRTYGDVNGVSSDVANAANFHIKGSESTTVNGDTYADILKEMNLSTDSAAQIKDASGNVIKTGNANTNPGYDIKASFDTDLTNYAVEEGTVGKEKIEKATLHLSTGDYTEAYGDAGAVQKDLNRATTVKGEKNGDSLDDLTSQIGIKNTTDALPSADRTNDVKYKTDGETPDSYNIITEFNKSLDNYDVVLDKHGTVTLTPVEITVDNEMIQTYGSQDRSFKEVVVPGLANGDKISTDGLKMAPKANGKYETNKGNRTTADAGTYNDDLAFSGGGIVHKDGKTEASKNYKVTIKGNIIVTPAPLTITTKDVTTEYGTVKETTSTATGLVNGDQNHASDISYNYGDYGHGYLDNNTRTNNVGSYDITTKAANTTGDFLKNYTISGGDATLTITPKDVYFHVDGKGSTFDDIIYTVTDPNHPGSRDAINSQLPYGETVTGGYGLGQALPGTPGSKDHYYTVDSTINGTPVYDNNGQGTQVGNYVYHPTGQAVIHFDPPQKPDQTTHYVEGARRPQDKIESALPVFRVDASGVVKQYGTYGIESKNQAVTLSPTGMRMPEPNQPSTQDRKYLTTLKTAHGHGTFRLEYNGVVLRVIPVDPAAEQIVTDGDKMKNVALSEQALHVAYTQMGLDLVNLKGVYIYMAPMSV